MSYKTLTEKLITLPSGATTIIRKISRMEIATSQTNPKETKIEAGVRLARLAILQCCGPIRFEQEMLTIVDRPWTATLAPNELSIEQLDQADAEAIINSVFEFSGLTEEAAAKAKSFRDEESENGSTGPHDGKALRDSPEPNLAS